MSPELIGLLFGALTFYSFFFIREAGYVQQVWLVPFSHRIHFPNVLDTLTDEEHGSIHDQIDRFNLQILACYLSAIIAVGTTLLFLVLILNEGDAKWAGYIASILFAYIAANFDLNTKIKSWVRASENELLARVLQNKADAGGFDTLGEYPQAENDKMVQEAMEEMAQIVSEFEEVAKECGWDPERDYEESEDSLEEFFTIMDKAQQIMREKHPDQVEPTDN